VLSTLFLIKITHRMIIYRFQGSKIHVFFIYLYAQRLSMCN
jgi:hypothetical protein